MVRLANFFERNPEHPRATLYRALKLELRSYLLDIRAVRASITTATNRHQAMLEKIGRSVSTNPDMATAVDHTTAVHRHLIDGYKTRIAILRERAKIVRLEIAALVTIATER